MKTFKIILIAIVLAVLIIIWGASILTAVIVFSVFDFAIMLGFTLVPLIIFFILREIFKDNHKKKRVPLYNLRLSQNLKEAFIAGLEEMEPLSEFLGPKRQIMLERNEAPMDANHAIIRVFARDFSSGEKLFTIYWGQKKQWAYEAHGKNNLNIWNNKW